MATKPAKKGFSHKKIERNVTLLGALALLTVTIGGIVEIAPLFWIDNTVEKVEGMERMIELGLLATPGVAVEGKVIFSGRIPKAEELRAALAAL